MSDKHVKRENVKAGTKVQSDEDTETVSSGGGKSGSTAASLSVSNDEAIVTGAAKKSATKGRKKSKKIVNDGFVHIQATFNNTLITVTDRQGNAIAFSSAGSCGFRGSRKSTPYAGLIAAEKAATAAKEEYQMKRVEVFVEGPGPGRDAIRGLHNAGLHVSMITDVTPIPHNGCRPPKKRRV
jgi:small subunit ribosomal protein S11